MNSVIKELWHGNIVPQDYSRNNSIEMKLLIEYMTRHHEDLLKTMTDMAMHCLSPYSNYSASKNGATMKIAPSGL